MNFYGCQTIVYITSEKLNSYGSFLHRQFKKFPERIVLSVYHASRRPNDSRMIVALGEAYRKLYRLQEAKKCFWKAHVLGDMEGIALVKLAKYFK